MACYSDEMKHKCSKVVLVISILCCVMGLLTCGYGFIASGGGSKIVESKQFDFAEFQTGFANVILAGGVLALITGVMGLLTAKFKNPFFTAPFVALSFIIGLLMFIGAMLSLFAAANITEARIALCDTPLPDSEETSGGQMDALYHNIVDKWMCSIACPCDTAKSAQFFQINSNKADIRGAYRENFAGNQDGVDVKEYKNIAALEKAPYKEYKRLVWAEASDDQKVFSDWQTCYNDVLKPYLADQTTDTANQFKEFMEQGGFEFMDQLEDSYQCAGACAKPMFYVTKSWEAGAVKNSCADAFLAAFAENKGVFAVAGLTAIVLFIGGCGAFPLCTDFAGKK